MAAPPRRRVAVFGSLNMDLVAYVPRHPQPGETLTASSFLAAPGGKGANQAAAVGRLSRRGSTWQPGDADEGAVDVAMLGAIGDDVHGGELYDALAASCVDVDRLRVAAGTPSGVALVVVDEPSGQNRIVLSPGANHTLGPADVPALLAPPPDLLVLQLEVRLDAVVAALAAARRAAVPVLLNPAPARPLPPDAYARLAHLVLNETEAAILADCPASDLDRPDGLRRVAALFLDRGVANVVITLGSRGAYYSTAAGAGALVPAVDVAVVDTTAAGDTFVGSYALAAVQADPAAFDVGRAVEAANRAAAITVSRKGSQHSIPWGDEVE